MVMHRAIVTWFILLVFFILLCLRLESRTHWNWFLIFFPLWLYDVILLIDALFNIIIHCKEETFKTIAKNKNNLLVLVIMLKIAAQIVICLKLEYESLNLEVYHVLIPFWILLPILIVDVSVKLFKNSGYCLCGTSNLTFYIMALLTGWRYGALIGGLVGLIGLACYPIIVYPMLHMDEYKEIQKRNRRGIKQEDIQPGNMKVWSDPFDRK